jgi:hypothetical protein
LQRSVRRRRFERIDGVSTSIPTIYPYTTELQRCMPDAKLGRVPNLCDSERVRVTRIVD